MGTGLEKTNQLLLHPSPLRCLLCFYRCGVLRCNSKICAKSPAKSTRWLTWCRQNTNPAITTVPRNLSVALKTVFPLAHVCERKSIRPINLAVSPTTLVDKLYLHSLQHERVCTQQLMHFALRHRNKGKVVVRGEHPGQV